MQPPFVSIIIPSYNRGRLLPITLDSFVAQSYQKDRFEIIIANNNSTDNTSDVISQYSSRYPCIKTIFEKRQGVHYARNSAAKIAKGDILYFTDDDMIADNDLLSQLVRVFDLDPAIGTATGLILPRFDATPPDWVKKYLINGYLSLTDQDLGEELIISRIDIGVFSCHQAIKRDAFFKSGGFNPENTAGVWIGDGETGLNIKLKELGYKFAFTSKAVSYHIIPKSRTTLKYLMQRIGNQAFCDSYTAYRSHRNKARIIPLMIRNSVSFGIRFWHTIKRIILGKQSWRFIPALIVYFYKRNIYDIKLYRNADFRKLVEIDNWLECGTIDAID